MNFKWKVVFLSILTAVVSLPAISIAQHMGTKKTGPTESTSPKELTREAWRAHMASRSPAVSGCFRAIYPHTTLEPIPCLPAPTQPFSRPKALSKAAGKDVGDRYDVALNAPAPIGRAVGSFKSVTGVQSITTKGGSLAGPNQYMLQLNTNDNSSTSACDNRPGCRAWQQFIYSTHYPNATSSGAIFMSYWLLNYGSPCPKGWWASGTSCWRNSPLAPVPSASATDLGALQLWAFTNSDGVGLQYGDGWYTYYENGSVLNISSVWTQAEFNVFGNANGSQAVFNTGSTLVVRVGANYNGDDNTNPTCSGGHAGTTGETNNLNMGYSCHGEGYDDTMGNPSMVFDEFN